MQTSNFIIKLNFFPILIVWYDEFSNFLLYGFEILVEFYFRDILIQIPTEIFLEENEFNKAIKNILK